MADKEIIHVELLIRLEGSYVENKLTTFELPIESRQNVDDTEGVVNFETKELVKAIKRAVDKLV